MDESAFALDGAPGRPQVSAPVLLFEYTSGDSPRKQVGRGPQIRYRTSDVARSQRPVGDRGLQNNVRPDAASTAGTAQIDAPLGTCVRSSERRHLRSHAIRASGERAYGSPSFRGARSDPS